MNSKNENNKQQQKPKQTTTKNTPKDHTMKIFTAHYPEILTYSFICCLRDL